LLTISEASKALAKGEIKVQELLNAHITMIERGNLYNSYISLIDSDTIKQNCLKQQQLIDSGKAGPLAGIPLAIKDVFCTKNIRTTAGSKMLENFVPNYEATVTDKLWQSGAINVGKTNMDEFAMGSDGGYSYFGQTINPWRPLSGEDMVPGGSSSGSAAAVASYSCMAALGSDTGGSVRQPAAFCGLVGIKPTYGRCSRWGMIAFASSLDQNGILARCVEDAAMVLDSVTGHDILDNMTLDMPATTTCAALNNVDIRGMNIGIPLEYQVEGIDTEVVAAWQRAREWLKERGANVIDISLANAQKGVSVYYVISPAEASSNLARYDGVRYGARSAQKDSGFHDMVRNTRSESFGSEVKRRIMIGTYVLSADTYDVYYAHAQRVRRRIADDFTQAFTRVDAILTPTTPSSAYKVGGKSNPTAAYLNDIMTIPASLAGLPAMSVPVACAKNGMPIGLQIIADKACEDKMIRVAKVIEEEAEFDKQRQERLLQYIGT